MEINFFNGLKQKASFFCNFTNREVYSGIEMICFLGFLLWIDLAKIASLNYLAFISHREFVLNNWQILHYNLKYSTEGARNRKDF